MGLYQQWESKISNQHGDAQAFFDNYLLKETEAYKMILNEGQFTIEGTLQGLAAHYDMDAVTFVGFLDGVNTSLVEPLDLSTMNEESSIHIVINPQRLYYNMINAKAHWLYGLEEWNTHLTLEERVAIKKQFNEDHQAVSNKVGRNDPCPCGSGKKYKKCCG